MSTFKNFTAIATVGAVSLMGAGIASAATTSGPVPSHHVLAAHVLKTKKVAFKGSFSGTIALLWSSTGVQATAVTGHGTGTLLGAAAMKGSGAGTAASTCNPFSGTGSLTGAGSKLMVKVVTSSKTTACAANSAAPTPVLVNGVATVTGGTGKYKGATGTLKFKGSFSIQSTTAGSNESDSFTATLTGTLTVKK